LILLVLAGCSNETGRSASKIDGECRKCGVLVYEVYSEAWVHQSAAGMAGLQLEVPHVFGRSVAATRAQPRLLGLYHQLIWSSTEGLKVES
jgi:hypothetical protein